MMALQPGRGVVAEDDLLVLGAELEDVDAVGAGHGEPTEPVTEGSADMLVPLSVAPRGWVA